MKKCKHCWDKHSRESLFCSKSCALSSAHTRCSWCGQRCGKGGAKFQNLTKDFCSEDCWNTYRGVEGV